METKTLAKIDAEVVMEGQVTPSITLEQATIEAARSDPEAFSRLYRQYVTPVYRYLYQWVGNRAEAEDLTSQVFTDVMIGLTRYQDKGNFTAWLFTIARRKAINAYRRRRKNLTLEEAEDLPGPSDDPLESVLQKEQLDRMARLFSRLKESQRDLLRLRFTACLGYREIGAILGRSEASVKMAISRLIRKIHKQWEG